MKRFSRSKFQFSSRGLLAFVLAHSYFQGPAHPSVFMCSSDGFQHNVGFFHICIKEKKKKEKVILALKYNLSFV